MTTESPDASLWYAPAGVTVCEYCGAVVPYIAVECQVWDSTARAYAWADEGGIDFFYDDGHEPGCAYFADEDEPEANPCPR